MSARVGKYVCTSRLRANVNTHALFFPCDSKILELLLPSAVAEYIEPESRHNILSVLVLLNFANPKEIEHAGTMKGYFCMVPESNTYDK